MRYTTKHNEKNVIPLLMAVCGINLPYWRIDRVDDLHSYLSGDAADKLAAYEDTGLTPEEFKESVGFVLELNKKLKPYMDAEEHGRLVILPCKVGDTVFVTDEGTVLPAVSTVESMTWCDGKVLIHAVDNRTRSDYCCWAEDLGKTVFLTREKAEAALKGEQNDASNS